MASPVERGRRPPRADDRARRLVRGAIRASAFGHVHVPLARRRRVQQTAGLVGALIVQDGPPSARPDDHPIFLKGGREAFINPRAQLEINGVSIPDTIVLRAGRPARLRFMSLSFTNPNATVTLTARPDSLRRYARYDARPVGAGREGRRGPSGGGRAPRVARQIVSMGETYDYTYTPMRPGQLRIEVRTAGQKGILLARVPVRVE